MIAVYYFVLTSMVAYGYIVFMKTKRELKIRNVIFRMTESELELVDRVARQEDRSRAQVLRRLVMDGLSRQTCDGLIANVR